MYRTKSNHREKRFREAQRKVGSGTRATPPSRSQSLQVLWEKAGDGVLIHRLRDVLREAIWVLA